MVPQHQILTLRDEQNQFQISILNTLVPTRRVLQSKTTQAGLLHVALPPDSDRKERVSGRVGQRWAWLALRGVLWKDDWRTGDAGEGLGKVQVSLPLVGLGVVHLHNAGDIVQVPVVASNDVDLPFQ